MAPKKNRDLGKIAQEIKALEKKSIKTVIEIGRLLHEAADQCDHGEYMAWVKTELGWSHQTSLNYRRAYLLSQNPKFCDFEKLNISISALYLIAEMDDDDPAFNAIIEAAKVGRVTYKMAKAIIRKTIPFFCKECGKETDIEIAHETLFGNFICDDCFKSLKAEKLADKPEEAPEGGETKSGKLPVLPADKPLPAEAGPLDRKPFEFDPRAAEKMRREIDAKINEEGVRRFCEAFAAFDAASGSIDWMQAIKEIGRERFRELISRLRRAYEDHFGGASAEKSATDAVKAAADRAEGKAAGKLH